MRSASVGVWVGVGSRDEGPSVAGAAHFLEHLLFKSTPTRSAVEITRRTATERSGQGTSSYLQVILEAANQLSSSSNICFLLVGDGNEKPRLQAQASEFGLKNVCFLPPVPKEQMEEVLAAADAAIAILKPLDLYKTTYPNKVFDYMAAGRPVILAIDGVIRQVVESAGAGIPVPPGNAQAIAQAACDLANDPIWARSMGMAGRRYIEHNFNRKMLAEKLALLLDEMRGSRG